MSHCHAQTLSGGACKNNPQGGSDFCAIHNTKRRESSSKPKQSGRSRSPSRAVSKLKPRQSSKPKPRQSSTKSSKKSSFFDIPTRFSGAVQAATRYGKAALPYGQAAIAAASQYGKAAVAAAGDYGSRMVQEIPVVKYGKAAAKYRKAATDYGKAAVSTIVNNMQQAALTTIASYGEEAVSSIKALMSPKQKNKFEWMTNLSECPALDDKNMAKLEEHGIDGMNSLVAKYFQMDLNAKDFKTFLRKNVGMKSKDAEQCVVAMQNSFG